MKPTKPSDSDEKPGELTQLERIMELLLIFLTGGLLLFIYLWIVLLA